jgi:hypothetical protein
LHQLDGSGFDAVIRRQNSQGKPRDKRMKLTLTLVGITLLLLVSLALKWQRYRYDPTDSAHRAGEIVFDEMRRSGFQLLEKRVLTKDGSYQVLSFSKPGCKNPTLISALGDNAEGLALFKNIAGNDSVGIVFAGEIFTDMPSMRIQSQRLFSALMALLQLPQPVFLRVLAVSPNPNSVAESCRFDVSFKHQLAPAQ